MDLQRPNSSAWESASLKMELSPVQILVRPLPNYIENIMTTKLFYNLRDDFEPEPISVGDGEELVSEDNPDTTYSHPSGKPVDTISIPRKKGI